MAFLLDTEHVPLQWLSFHSSFLYWGAVLSLYLGVPAAQIITSRVFAWFVAVVQSPYEKNLILG